ncbi:MAG: response regulator transcription factor [Gammaproteobacteria bacterium]|nr:response regulator transcription factor [Gammaproteobacteria bacterium]
MAVQVLVADDHPLFREAIVHLLTRTIPEVVIHEASSLAQSRDILSDHRGVSLLLLDLKLSDTSGIDGLLYLKKTYPSVPVIVISAYDNQAVIQDALRYGASGFIPKHLGMDEIAEAINIVLEGDVWFPGSDDIQENREHEPADQPDFSELTATQIKVLSLLRDGKPSKEMATILSVTEATVKAHLTEIYRKLNVRNRTQAVVLAKGLELPDA